MKPDFRVFMVLAVLTWPGRAAAQSRDAIVPSMQRGIPAQALPTLPPDIVGAIDWCFAQLPLASGGVFRPGTRVDFPPRARAQSETTACSIIAERTGLGGSIFIAWFGFKGQLGRLPYAEYALRLRGLGGTAFERYDYRSLVGDRRSGYETAMETCGPFLCGSVIEYSPSMNPVRFEGRLEPVGLDAEPIQFSLASLMRGRNALSSAFSGYMSRLQAGGGLRGPQQP